MKAQAQKTVITAMSVCPVCLRSVPALKAEEDGVVVMRKSCPWHGDFAVTVWHGTMESYIAWGQGSAQPDPFAPGPAGCPGDCGLCLGHMTRTCCALLEVTDRCTLACPVCYASSGPDGSDVPFEELAARIGRLKRICPQANIQISGGEPTLRDDLSAVVSMVKSAGFPFVQLNTNGIRIGSDPVYLDMLARAGLDAVFLQFDTLDDAACAVLRGKPLVAGKIAAVDACARAGVSVILTPTVVRGVNDRHLGAILEFAARRVPAVRGVHFQPASAFGRFEIDRGEPVTIPALISLLCKQTQGRLKPGDFTPAGAANPYCSLGLSLLVSPSGAIESAYPSDRGIACCSPEQAARVTARRFSSQARTAGTQEEQWEAGSLDAFLDAWENHTLHVSAMFFQDALNFETGRSSRCHVHVSGPGGSLTPFCACSLTGLDGSALHRGERL